MRSRVIQYIQQKFHIPNDEADMQSTILSIRNGAELSGANLWVLVAAIFIASLGLNTNSTAVIIGAMLVSPLMGPIMGFGLGLGIDDLALVKRAARNFIIMVLISVITSSLYFLISPVKEAGSELLGRTSPTIYDVLIAFFGGLAGIIAGASSLRSSTVIPGVAIATALMPPLCTMGYGISNLQWQYTAGAFYLFMINCVFIGIATYLVVNLLRFPNVTEKNPARRRRIHGMITLLVVVITIPSVYLTYHIVKKYFYQQRVEAFIKNEVQNAAHIVISSKFDYKPKRSKLELILVGDAFDSTQIKTLESKIKEYGLADCRLVLHQGPDSRQAVKGMFDDLSSDMALQSLSIKEMYIKMDSMQRGLNGSILPDSLQVKLARQVFAIDTTLIRLSVQRTFSFNPVRNNQDTTWRVIVFFKNAITDERKYFLEDWLRKRLQPGNVMLQIESP
ncbi:MAG TPA: DUF389 domain-containing protein [Chitinophagaceae bacterium]|nr:DUF389 domain-containing protein [Chitinophagaceae bacterium]